MEKLKNNIGPALVIIAALIGLAVVINDFSSPSESLEQHKEYGLPNPHVGSDTIYLDGFSEENLIRKINREGILYTNIVMAQAKLETGNFKSQVFKENNNLFGFVGKKGYIKYNNWQESVEDYAEWQRKYYKSGDYYNFLERIGYAEDSTYTEKLRRMD